MTATATRQATPLNPQPAANGVRVVKALLIAALVSVSIAVGAGLALLLVDPRSGSSTEAALGFTAAISGLATAGLVIAAVIYAQVKNLWTVSPNWIRYGVLALVAVGVIRSIVSIFT